MYAIPFTIQAPVLVKSTIAVPQLYKQYMERLEDLRLILAKTVDTSFKAGYLNMTFTPGVATIDDHSRAYRLYADLSLGTVVSQLKADDLEHREFIEQLTAAKVVMQKAGCTDAVEKISAILEMALVIRNQPYEQKHLLSADDAIRFARNQPSKKRA